MSDWAEGIPDREFYKVGEYPIPDHLLFAPWANYGELGEHVAKTGLDIVWPRFYFLFTACKQGIAAGDGELWELGVYRGDSAALLASMSVKYGRTLRLFDTFQGMPDTDPELDRFHKAGDFSDTSLDAVRTRLTAFAPDVVYQPGFVPSTFAGRENARIAFAHVDLDIYHPIKATCEFVFPRLVLGGAMIFDDYGWASCPGARQAVDEYFAGRPEQVFSLPTGQALVVKVTA